MSRLPDSLKKLLSTAQIHPVPLVEIGFRLTGNDCGQVIDNIWSIRHERFRDTRLGNIGREGVTSNGAPAGAAGLMVSAIVSRSTDLLPMFPRSASASQNLRPIIPAAPVTRIFIPRLDWLNDE